jgi:hypothetical protein
MPPLRCVSPRSAADTELITGNWLERDHIIDRVRRLLSLRPAGGWMGVYSPGGSTHHRPHIIQIDGMVDGVWHGI